MTAHRTADGERFDLSDRGVGGTVATCGLPLLEDVRACARLLPLAIRGAVLRGALFVWIVVSVLCAAPALAGATGGWEGYGRSPGAVYTMTNEVSANAIVAFRRHGDGTLTKSAEVLTGGRGADNQPPFGFAVVDTSQAMRLSPDGRLLFAVNSGDNSVSSFRITVRA